MLPEPYRLHHHADFSRTVRRGHRIGRRDLVVHAIVPEAAPEYSLERVGGPRFGLIVNKAVGNAVVRHRVSRRLRHVCAALLLEDRELSGALTDMDIVIRALPSAAGLSSRDLAGQVRSGLKKLVARSADASAPV